MFFPFGDYPNPRKPQWITRILIAANVLVHLLFAVPLSGRPVDREFLSDPANLKTVEDLWEVQRDHARQRGIPQEAWLAQLSQYDVFTFRHGYKPARPELAALLACMFLHANFMHLFGNMLFLWIFGDNVEARLGRVRYLVAYLGTGALATLAFAVLKPGSMTPLVGASGAIAGINGFYLIWFPHNQIRVLVFYFFIMVVHVRAVWVLGAYLLLDFLPVWLGLEDGVAHGAHLGGFAAGMGGALLVNVLRGTVPAPRPQPYVSGRGTPWRPPRVRTPPVVQDPSGLFRAAIQSGRMEDAAHAFASLLRDGGAPPAPEHVFQLARWLYDNRFAPDAAAVFRFYIRNYPRGSDLDLAHLGLGILLVRHLAQPSAAREHLLAAIDISGAGSRTAATAREELARIE